MGKMTQRQGYFLVLRKNWKTRIAVMLAMIVLATTLIPNNREVMAATTQSITLNSKQEVIAEGKSVKLQVKSVKGLKSKAVIWKSSNKKVAGVNAKGKVTALKAGNAKITATSKKNKKIKATCKIIVTKSPVESIQLDKTACVVEKGKTVKVKIKSVIPSTASAKMKWKVKKTSIATISVKGKTVVIKGKKKGKTTLTATAADGSNKTAKVDIVVVDKKSAIKKITGIQVNLLQDELYVGDTTNATAAITPSNATLKKILWAVDNEEIAQIDTKGKITALQAGTVTIIATAQDGSGKKAAKELVVKQTNSQTLPETPTDKLPETSTDKLPEISTEISTETPEEKVEEVPEERPSEEWCDTIEAAGKILREGLKKRTELIELQYVLKEQEVLDDVLKDISDEAFWHTGIPNEGDYLKYQVAGWTTDITGEVKNGISYCTIQYNVKYYTDYSQENTIDTTIDTVMTNLNIEGEEDYYKIKSIYDYICKNVTYDYEHLEDESYQLKYTAYAALVNGTAVCQGYANLLYRMLLEAGIDARIVSGSSNGEAHSWNIVKLENEYYYLDATWDSQRTEYGFFLRGTSDFEEHVLGEEYITDEFQKNYAMAEVSFTHSSAEKIHEVYTSDDWLKIQDYTTDKFILMNDIDLSLVEWNTITSFSGEIDGNGYTVENVTRGLFETLTEHSVVKNLTIDANMTSVVNTAALTVNANGTIENCVVKGTISAGADAEVPENMAAFACMNNGVISNCTNEAEINQLAGGHRFTSVGGIAALNYGKIINCINTGVITSKSCNIGGIAGNGFFIGYIKQNGIISGCENRASIISNYTSDDGLNDAGRAGGIAGCVKSLVYNCKNTGSVTCIEEMKDYTMLGGICGMASRYAYIIHCENYAKIQSGICGKASIVTISAFDENDRPVFDDGSIVIADCINEISGLTQDESQENYTICGYANTYIGKIAIIRCENKIDGEASDKYVFASIVYEDDGMIEIKNNGAIAWEGEKQGETYYLNVGDEMSFGESDHELYESVYMDIRLGLGISENYVFKAYEASELQLYGVTADGKIYIHDVIVN